MTPLPFGVTLCRLMIGWAAYLVPLEVRSEWTREWQARIWHQWQFLHFARAFDRREEWWLVQRCLWAFPQALSVWWRHDDVQHFQRKWLSSLWVPFIALGMGFLLVAGLSGGLPATRLLFAASSDENTRELFILLHPGTGGGDRPLPSDVVPAWAEGSQLLEGIAGFVLTKQRAVSPALKNSGLMLVRTSRSLFPVLAVQPAAGRFPHTGAEAELVVDYQAAEQLAQFNRKLIGSRLRVGAAWYRVAAVLPKGFHFLTRQPLAFLVEPFDKGAMSEANVMVVARTKPGVTKADINRELTRIAEDKTYYFFASQLRLRFAREAILMPISLFGGAAFLSGVLALCVGGLRMRDTKRNWTGARSRWALRRVIYFIGKTAVALILIFVAGLELCRTTSAVLLSSKDPANGPFLLWLYIAGSMAVFFWSIADSRVRCRTCLRRLCSPVRVGSPGCLLLDWSGTELICSAGHGVLHIPHMTTSWESDSEHWITMDESWHSLFVDDRKAR